MLDCVVIPRLLVVVKQQILFLHTCFCTGARCFKIVGVSPFSTLTVQTSPSHYPQLGQIMGGFENPVFPTHLWVLFVVSQLV